MTDAPRIAPLPPDGREPRTQELLQSLRFDPEAEDLNLFATLAHHPRLLKRWSQFGGLLLAGGTLTPREREVLILRTAANCGADYEWGHHLPIGEAAGLTKNEMTVRTVVTPCGRVELTGIGYAPQGEMLLHGSGEKPTDPILLADVRRTLLSSALANNSVLEQKEGAWTIQGDPTEAALVVAA